MANPETKTKETRERDEVVHKPEAERQEILDIMARYGVSAGAASVLADELSRDPDMWVRFMMDFELRLERPDGTRAWMSALTMGLSYLIGGLIPMIPYFGMQDATKALFVSIGITVVILLGFGYAKTAFTVANRRGAVWGALQTLVIGVLAAGASYGIVRALDAREQVVAG